MSTIFGAPLNDGQSSLTQPSYSKGTNFFDGVRIGPNLDIDYTQPNYVATLLPPQYAPDGATPIKSIFSTILSPQTSNWGAGVMASPIATYSIAPWKGPLTQGANVPLIANVALFKGPLNSSAIASFDSGAQNIMTSPTGKNQGPTWLSFPNAGSPYIQCDYPRSLDIFAVGTGPEGIITGGPVKIEVWSEDGWGQRQYTKYPQPSMEILGSKNTSGFPLKYTAVPYPGTPNIPNLEILSNRTHSRIFNVRLVGNLAADEYVAVVAGNCFGLPYYYDYLKSYFTEIMWQGCTERTEMANAAQATNPVGIATTASFIPGQNYDFATTTVGDVDLTFTETNLFTEALPYTYGVSAYDLDYRGTYNPSTTPLAPNSGTYGKNRLVMAYYTPGGDNNFNIQSWSGQTQFNMDGNADTVPCVVKPDLIGFTPYWEPLP